jgi:WD40 repeat protein
MANWYIKRDGYQDGPIGSAELKVRASSGQIKRTDMVRREDLHDFLAAGSIKGLFPPPTDETMPTTDQPPLPNRATPQQTRPLRVHPSEPIEPTAARKVSIVNIFAGFILIAILAVCIALGWQAIQLPASNLAAPSTRQEEDVAEQLEQLNTRIEEWKSKRSKLSGLVSNLDQDKKNLVRDLHLLGASPTDQKSSNPKASVLLAELRDVLKQSVVFDKKHKEYDLAIFKSESRVRTFERRIAAKEVAGSDEELTALIRSMAELDQELDSESEDEIPIELDDMVKNALAHDTSNKDSSLVKSLKDPPTSVPLIQPATDSRINSKDIVFPSKDSNNSQQRSASSNSRDMTPQKTGTSGYNSIQPSEAKVFSNHVGAVLSVAVSRGGSRVVTGAEDGLVRVWNTNTGSLLWQESLGGKIIFVAFSQDGQRIAASSQDSFRIFQLDTGYASMKAELPIKSSTVSASRDFRRLLLIPTSQDKKYPAILFDTSGKQTIRSFRREPGVATGTLSPDGEIVVCGEYAQDIYHLLNGQDQKRTFTNWGYLEGMAISSRGTFLATGSGKLWEKGGDKMGNRQVRIWNLETGKEQLSLSGHSSWIHAVAISPDDTRILSAGGGSPGDHIGERTDSDRQIRLWSISERRVIWTGTGHGKAVTSVAFSPDGEYAVSGSRDRTARLWKVPAK